MPRHQIVQDPKRWDHCRGEDGPVKRQHVWQEVCRDLLQDEEHLKRWWVVYACACGDGYTEIYEWNNLLLLEAALLDIPVRIIEFDPEESL